MPFFTLRFLLLAACCFSYTLLFSQIPTFQKAYFGEFRDDCFWGLEANDGFLLAGRGRPWAVPGVWNGLLIRTDKQGEIIWYRNYGSGNAQEYFQYASATDDGGFIAYGSAQGDVWLVRVDSAGEVLWQKTLGDSLFHERPDGPVVSVPNGFVISGTKKSSLETLGSFVTRIDNDGDVLWSRYYATDTPSIVRNLAVHHATDSALYAISLVGKKVGFISMNPANGDIIKAVEYEHPNYSLVSNGLKPTLDGNLALQGIAIPNSPNEPSLLWMIIINSDGQVIRSKAYPSNYTWGGLLAQFSTLSDGGFILGTIEANQSGPTDRRMLMKLDSNGEVLWKKSYGKVPPSNFLVRCFESSDGGLVAVGTHYSEGGDDDFFLMKTDTNGEVASCCSQKRDVIPAIYFPIEAAPAYYQQENYLSTVTFNLTPPYTLSYFDTSICIVSARPTLHDTLRFCPGETVTIGDSTYSQPGTATLYLPSTTDGCDTLLTYTLEHEPLDPNSALQLTCPNNVTVSASNGPVAVTYDEPTAFSDCLCPETVLTRTSGGASGSLFPIGTNTVCFRADDACGQTKTCCFSVKVEAQTSPSQACDVKTNGCLRFELLEVNRDASQQWVYYIRVTNNCADAVKYAYFQVPGGLQATAPANNGIYTSPNGNNYTVRNPNFSPFYSVRFQPAGATLAGGQSDVFRYVLPQQADVDYIHVAVRLTSGALVEAHLNTFSCPVGTEPSPKPETGERNAHETSSSLKVYPNPLSFEETLFVRGENVEGGVFSLQDLTGRVLLETPISGGQVSLKNSNLAKGIYFFKIWKNEQPVGSGKVAVVR